MNNDVRLIDASRLIKTLRELEWITDNPCDGNNVLEDIIDNAPTVESTFREVVAYECGQKSNERPTGEWIIDGHHYKCSQCGKTLAIIFSETDDDDLIGCPFCLADMRKNERCQHVWKEIIDKSGKDAENDKN